MQNKVAISISLVLKVTAVVALSILAFACKNDESKTKTSAMPPIPTQNPENEIEVEQQGRLARIGSAEICPRLIQKRVDSTQVVRQESITGQTCDYFIYPQIGDVVTVQVSDDRMKPKLRSPYVYDFANGAYRVVQAGRHVIRLEYDAFDIKPDVMNYTIEVDIKPVR